MNVVGTVHIVDDDDAFRDSLRRLVESQGMAPETHPNAEAFLARDAHTRPCCLVLDMRMPGLSGLELQKKLLETRSRIPIIILSAHGSVETAVRAMKAGAVDFIKKPYDPPALLTCIRKALACDARRYEKEKELADIEARFQLLTPRETEVMELLVAGHPPKRIAFELDISRKTVDVHRSHVLTKLRVDSVLGLLKLTQALKE